ncbi:MAG: DUF4911 domain-containing protein [Desulfobacteraceae bacterium]|jgi:hypothetical protein
METIRKSYLVDRSRISYIRWIVESYDGMAIVSTIDPVDAVIELKIAPGCESTVNELIRSLRVDEGIKLNPV